MPNYKKLALFAISFFAYGFAIAQTSASTTAANEGGVMRSEGKIYVVMAVVITILAGLLFYIVRLDRKITRLEKGNV
ncbi:CcmD family protein [Segetibacter aerophilus]|uniref:CcmD family protein n=1 Tax=Segetibacter aerophilus TaxID=670293 RepID=A0A512BBL3_9BACT|nr:CcmD family protein [Segetibacter aerophilus]GEO09275.1 hypothetical protein SAE01_17710 [Segetibacter aerophilus]